MPENPDYKHAGNLYLSEVFSGVIHGGLRGKPGRLVTTARRAENRNERRADDSGSRPPRLVRRYPGGIGEKK